MVSGQLGVLIEYSYHHTMSLWLTRRHLSPTRCGGEMLVTFDELTFLPSLLAPLQILRSGTEEGHEAGRASLDHGN